MTRRGFLSGLGSLPLLGFIGDAKRSGAQAPVQAKDSPVREAVGSALDDHHPRWRETNFCFEVPGEMFSDGESRTVLPGSGVIVKSRDMWPCMKLPKGGAS